MKEDLKEIIGALDRVIYFARFENVSKDFKQGLKDYNKDLNDLYNGIN
jgi:hypothetical protein